MVPQARQLILSFLLLAPVLFAGDYYISYRLHTHNFLVQDEHFRISKAMVPFQGDTQKICIFSSEAESFEAFAKAQRQPLLECLMEHGILIRSWERITDLLYHDASLELILPPVQLQVDFNDGLVIVRKVKSKK